MLRCELIGVGKVSAGSSMDYTMKSY